MGYVSAQVPESLNCECLEAQQCLQAWPSQPGKLCCQTLQESLSGQDSAIRSSRRRSKGRAVQSDLVS